MYNAFNSRELMLKSETMGIRGLIRDLIMFFVGYQLIFGTMEKIQLGLILIIAASIFTILAFYKMFRGV